MPGPQFQQGDSEYEVLRKILQNLADISANGIATDVHEIKIDADQIVLNTDDIETMLAALVAKDYATHAAQVDGSQKTEVTNGAGAAAVNIQDGGNSITVDGTVAVSNFPAVQPVSGTVDVSDRAGRLLGIVASIAGALPAGANTIGKVDQGTGGASAWKVDGSAVTQPISAAALPLPAGASTAANQATANTSLASIDAKLTSPIAVTSTPASAAQTYSASIIGLVPALLATDLFEIAGSASKTVKVLRMRVTGTRTASTTNDIVIVKRSTANTGGTSTTPTRVPLDSTNSAATAVVKAYTANPTVGTLIGNVRADKQFLNMAGTGASDVREYNFSAVGGQPIVLRGVAESIAFNLNGVTVTGGNYDISVEWTEE